METILINNGLTIEYCQSNKQTPATVTLPISVKTLKSVVATTTDNNDGYVDSTSCYNLTSSSFTYLIGTNVGSKTNGLCFFICIGT